MANGAVLVTGTSSGIGLQTAIALAGQGYNVYATMRNLGRRDVLDAEAARADVGLKVLQLDVTDPLSIQTAVDAIIADSGTIQGLVNNAGVCSRGYFEDLADSQVHSIFETNVFGTMAVIRAVLPHMRQAHCGRIVIVTSVSGRIGAMAMSPYSASKFALEGLGEALALELAPLGIRVSMVAPGITKTKIWGPAAREYDPSGPYSAWFRRWVHMADRMMDVTPIMPEDVARTIARAFAANRPRLRYVVGKKARALFLLRHFVPGDLFDRLYASAVVRRVEKGD